MAQKHNQNETQNAPMTRLGNLQLNAQQRIIRGTAFLSTSFSANNPILQLGELGYETDTNKLKIGDGVTAWNDLAYAGDGGLPLQTGQSGKFLTTDGTDASWTAVTKVNTTVTIAVADWDGGTTVTKTVAGITATGVVLVSPDPTDQSAYTTAGIICTTQATDSLTFTCSTTPASDIDVVVVML